MQRRELFQGAIGTAAALAATLPQPLTSNPAYQPGRMRWRQSLILDRLDPTRSLPPEPLLEPDVELVNIDLRSRPLPRTTPEWNGLGTIDVSASTTR